jgi:hypothetical protein
VARRNTGTQKSPSIIYYMGFNGLHGQHQTAWVMSWLLIGLKGWAILTLALGLSVPVVHPLLNYLSSSPALKIKCNTFLNGMS